MKYILFIILIAIIFLIIFYYDRKYSLLKHQLIVSNKSNSSLKEKLSKYGIDKSTIKVAFSTPSKLLGIIKEKTSIFLCPIENTILMHRTNIKMEVHILDQCIINNTIWFYVDLPTDSNINCRGWVMSINFLTFYDTLPSITEI
ncbi:hypothetical protein [Clostridium vincentii]|uniref:Uncharacterized protein n=1 Tax=Clostridium vincentii TaxID=52704 RepID=A0A2T0B7V7_9CLOT|nr:hypothetical protein [Clostridium vincentii]PRR79971.1 hypothetical protein CLVI_31580 [Clostridium vincentii]